MTTRPGRRHLLAVIAASLLVFVVALAGWAFIEPRLLLVSRAVVSSPDVPAEFDGARIAFASDIHAGTMLGEQRVVRVVNRLNELNADVLLLGGDYISGGESGSDMFYPQAGRLRAHHGAIAVLGNHEGDGEEARRRFADTGVVLLENDVARVRRGGGIIRVAGVQDPEHGSPDLRGVAREVRLDDFAILVAHNPDVLVEGLPEAGKAFDLVLSGHTHGGQISLFGLWAPLLPSEYGQRFNGGWTEVEGAPVLVSRGVGVFQLPIRLFAPPEVHLIELRQGPAGVTHESTFRWPWSRR